MLQRLLVFLAILGAADPAWSAIDPLRLKAIKAATPFIRIDTRPGPSSGSGFLMQRQGRRGLVVTNAHVVRNGDNRKIEVVFRSGTRDAIKLPGKILVLDRAADLAVLEVLGPGLPQPIALGNSESVTETQELFIVGYPFGTRFATNRDTPTITVGRGIVSSRRLDINDHTYLLQVDGDINPGNSGGPVIDAQGNVIGVAVATVQQTNIGFAIPASAVSSLLNGQIGNLYAERSAAGLELIGERLDPMGRISSARLLYAPRSSFSSHFDGARSAWQKPTGNVQMARVKLKGPRARAEITGAPGQTLVAQLAVTSSLGEIFSAPFEIEIRKLGARLKGPAVLPEGKRKQLARSGDDRPASKLSDAELIDRLLLRSGLNEFIDHLTHDADLLFRKDEDQADADDSGQGDVQARLKEILSESWDQDRVQRHYRSIFTASLDRSHARSAARLFALPLVRDMHVTLSAFSSSNREKIQAFTRKTNLKSKAFKALLKKYRRIDQARQLSATMSAAVQTSTLAVARLVNGIQPLSTRMSEDQVDASLQPLLDRIDNSLRLGVSVLLAMHYQDTPETDLDDYLTLVESDAYRWYSATERKAFTSLLSTKLALAETDLRKLLREVQHEAAGVTDVGSLEGLSPAEAIDKLFKAYGKEAVVHYLIKKGDGNVSIKQGRVIRQTLGRPRQDLVTPETVLVDLERNRIDIATLARNLDEQAIGAAYRDRRLDAISAARKARSRAIRLQRSRTQQLLAASRACAAQCYSSLDQCSASPQKKQPVKIGNRTRMRSCSYIYNRCMRSCRKQSSTARTLLRAEKRVLRTQ